MPQTNKSDKWFIRITAPWSHIETKILELQGWIDFKSYAIGYHIGNKTKKPHAHIAIIMAKELQQQSMNVRIKKVFDVSKSDFASKVWDGSNKVLSYLYHDKEGKVEFHKMDLTPEQVAAIKQVAEVYEGIVTDAKEKASTRIPDKVLQVIADSGKTWSPREIARYIYSEVSKGTWHSPGPMMDRYVEEILVRQTGGDEYVDYLTDKFMAKWAR